MKKFARDNAQVNAAIRARENFLKEFKKCNTVEELNTIMVRLNEAKREGKLATPGKLPISYNCCIR